LGDQGNWGAERGTSDVFSAAGYLMERSGMGNVSVVALRAGSILASKAVCSGLNVNDVVLWDPILEGAEYLSDITKIHKSLLDEKCTMFPYPTEKDLRLHPDELLGFRYSPDFRAQLKSFSFSEQSFPGCNEIKLIVSEQTESLLALKKRFESGKKPLSVYVENGGRDWDEEDAYEKLSFPGDIFYRIVTLLSGDGS